MKKFFFLLSILLSMVGTKALAYDYAVENTDDVTIYYNLFFNSISDVYELEVDRGGYSGSVVIPEEVTLKKYTRKVTRIGEYAFQNCDRLTSVTIPGSVTSIGYEAFSGCSGLTSITIPNSVTSIGISAFKYCSSLTSITIPNSVTSIGNGAFSYCSGLTSITIPNSVTILGWNAFSGCSKLTSVTIGNNMTIIGNEAFSDCSGLTSVTIPNSVISIGIGVFRGCSSLISVTIGNSVTSIGERTFQNCDLPEVISRIENPFDINTNTFSDYTLSNATLYVPVGTVDKYKNKEGWNKFTIIKEETGGGEEASDTDVDVIKITSAKQTTWCSKYDLDFTDVEGLKAYTAEGYDRETGTIWLMRVKKVPAGEGILLIGDEGEYKVPHKTTTCYYGNFMVGTLSAKTINETDGEYTNYYLSNGSFGIGFYMVNGSVEIKANRAYLPLLKNTVSGTRGFIGMDFDDDEDGTTGIEVQSSIFNVQSKDVYYNLQGQRVDNPTKGLYIRNGKKVVIK